MTNDASIGANYKNTFYALTRTNATHPIDSEIKMGIDHLVDLGLPIFPLMTFDETIH